ncbi:MAG: hypothetical protein EB072_15220 [Betaproteobacteria bacterium]|nr:hypothetical protein [Betaproteobacteria bacterium]
MDKMVVLVVGLEILRRLQELAIRRRHLHLKATTVVQLHLLNRLLLVAEVVLAHQVVTQVIQMLATVVMGKHRPYPEHL